MPRLPILLLLTAFLAGPAAHPATAEAPTNIVFIMADDVGLGDIGYYHTQRTGRAPLVATPHMDALAQAGMRFSDAHSSTALCSPTRYCVMTGNLNYRSYAPWGVWGSFRKSPVTDQDATLGRVAKRAGLATGFVGKWHLGGDFAKADGSGVYRGDDRGDDPLPVDASKVLDGGPRALGFDFSLMMPCGIQGPLYVAYENGDWHPFSEESELIHLNKESALYPEIVSDKGPGTGDSHWDTRAVGPMLADAAETFIRGRAAAGEPFFLYYCSPMVHIPHLPPDDFDGRAVAGRGPSPHLDMVIDLDQQVGRIVKALKESGQYENTLIVFSSDNGGLFAGQSRKAGHNSSHIYRGSKNSPHEGGHRVPFFAVWPGKIQPGSESAEPIAVHDVLATTAGLFGLALEEHQAMDSLDLAPLLTGDERFAGRDELLLQGGSRNELIYRRGHWKLIIQSDHKLTKWDPIALFDLEANPQEDETQNFIDHPDHAERVREMHTRYMQLRETGARTTPAVQ